MILGKNHDKIVLSFPAPNDDRYKNPHWKMMCMIHRVKSILRRNKEILPGRFLDDNLRNGEAVEAALVYFCTKFDPRGMEV